MRGRTSRPRPAPLQGRLAAEARGRGRRQHRGRPRALHAVQRRVAARERASSTCGVAGAVLGAYTRNGKIMARADLILTLIKASRQGDDLQVRKAVEAMAADERAKNHTILADRLLAQLQSGNGRHGRQTPLLARSASSPLVAETLPARCLADLILSVEAAETVRELVAEQHRADLLRSYSLEPRNRVLLAGPPGNGKTTLAEAELSFRGSAARRDQVESQMRDIVAALGAQLPGGQSAGWRGLHADASSANTGNDRGGESECL